MRHYTANEQAFLDTNVGGTEMLLALAKEAEAVFYHISTASIGGDFLREHPGEDAVFTEADFYIGQNWEDNVYIRSKFLSEAAVYRAMREGLNARVYRLGRITGRCSDHVFQKNPESNGAFLLMRAIRCVGAISRSMSCPAVDLSAGGLVRGSGAGSVGHGSHSTASDESLPALPCPRWHSFLCRIWKSCRMRLTADCSCSG